jgi:hypothetical protein
MDHETRQIIIETAASLHTSPGMPGCRSMADNVREACERLDIRPPERGSPVLADITASVAGYLND